VTLYSTAATIARVNGLRIDHDTRLARPPSSDRSSHPLLDFSGHRQKSGLDVCGILRARLKKRNAFALGEFLGDGGIDHLLGRHIGLVADEQLVDRLGGVAVDLLEPLLDVVVCDLVRHVIDDDDSVRPAIIRRRDRPEPLLPCRVPDLKFDGFPVELNGSNFEIDADRADITLGIRVVCKAKEKA